MIINILASITFIMLGMNLIDVFLYFKQKEGPVRQLYQSDLDFLVLVLAMAFVILLFPYIIFTAPLLSLKLFWLAFPIQFGFGIFLAIHEKEKILKTCDAAFNKNKLPHIFWYFSLISMIIFLPIPYILKSMFEFIINVLFINNVFYKFYKNSKEKQ